MSWLVLDVENTTTKISATKKHMDPFWASNKLVQVGYLSEAGKPCIETFHHQEYQPTSEQAKASHEAVQQALDSCSVLIGHNIKHDLMWLWECGFTYDGPVFDTMLCEYVLDRAQKSPLSLDACAERYELDHQKQDTLKAYFSKGYNTDEIPLDELTFYLEHDLLATRDLYLKQQQRLYTTDQSLETVIGLTMETCMVLARLYQNGLSVDMDALDEVEQQFLQERNELETELQKMSRELMGDTPINLGSPEQLSWLVYSRKPLDKKTWPDLFNPFMSTTEFRKTMRENTEVLRKTRAETCKVCKGEGKVQKLKKDGTPFKNKNLCHDCGTRGYTLHPTKEQAGLKFSAPDPQWVSASGFSTSKIKLGILSGVAREKGLTEAQSFLDKVARLSAVNTYLANFIGGVRTFLKSDGLLHVDLTQSITATGRFSGRDPNMQNMPRGGTFPVKKAFVSRWDGGYIMEADFAQLEFRGAAFLAQDETAMKEVEEGFDVHAYTAKIISEAGQQTSRQEAKAHTFAPLYGATGHGRTPAEAAYYIHFTEKYRGIARWHKKLAQQALSLRKIITPSGREFAFPNVKRRRDGTVTDFTRIKNYPVQSWATADCVPVALIAIHRGLADMQSCVVNSVHDSIVIDIHPDERDQVIQVIADVQGRLHPLIYEMFGVDFNVPLLLEPKIGPNWLEQVDC